MKNKAVLIKLSVAVFFMTMLFFVQGVIAKSDVETRESGDWKYTVISEEDKTAEIFSKGNVTGTVEIPENIDGYTVISIGDSAFATQIYLEGVTIPETVKKIGYRAFSYCTLLKSITLPKNLTSIGEEAFNYCNALGGSLVIPSTVTEIGKNAFNQCKALENVILSVNLTAIPEGAFDGCSKIKTVSIPDKVTSLGEYAFRDCEALEDLYLSKNLKTIDQDAFYQCTSLKSVNIPNSVTTIGQYSFYGSGLNSIAISSKLDCIPEYAFGNTQFVSISIPGNVTKIENDAFASCWILESVLIENNSCNIEGDPFEYNEKSIIIYGDSGSTAESFAKSNGYEFKSKSEFAPQATPRPVSPNWIDPTNTESPLPSTSPMPTSTSENKIVPDSKPSSTPEEKPKQTEAPTAEPSIKPLPSEIPSPSARPVDITSKDPVKRFSDVSKEKWYSKPDGPIAYVIENNIMSGTGDGTTFDPEGDCTREMFVKILYNVEGEPGSGPSNPFKDVKNGKWYTDAVTWAVANKVTSGIDATTFGMGGKVTREQLAQFLMNYANFKGYDTLARADLSKYPDSNEVSGWAKNAVSWANANGIINGKLIKGINYLSPKGNAQRAEVAQMVMSFKKKFG